MNSNSIGHSSNNSSAIPLSRTGSAAPPSPALQPSDTQRLGWNNTECGQEELGPSEDPSLSSVDHSLRDDLSFADTAATPLLSALDPDAAKASDDDDDRTCLTGKALPEVDLDAQWSSDLSLDPERSAGLTSRPIRQSTISSSFINAFCRASTRAASVQGDYILLEEVGGRIKGTTQPLDIPLRGYALGVLGSANPLRVWLYKLLIQKYTEPTILALIIVNAVALVVQGSRTLLLPPDKVPITVKGYFHAWEDFVIFVLFIIFTVESLGRMCLTGLVLDPDIPTSSLFSFSKLSSVFDNVRSLFSLSQSSHARTPSFASKRTGVSLQSGSSRRGSLPQSSNVRPPSPTPGPTRIPSLSSASHHQSQRSTSPSRVTKLDSNPDPPVSLPFQLDLEVARSKVERNIPYLRQGWGRIDFLAVIGFWLSFALATAGLERGTQHIGVFRALSVLRTARLLAVTNRTASIMRSLKIARPLLANVIYFVVFAMVLFVVIGMQSFQTSLRRSCTLLPVLGAGATRLNQACGGHINATTLAPSPYLLSNGTPASITKGFVCPLGQVCQAGENPFSGMESFDTVYHAALQIVILSSAGSWAQVMYQIIASEYDVAAAFFIFGVLVLNFWLFNLLVAVITNTFSAIRAGTEESAFGATSLRRVVGGGRFMVMGRPDDSNRLKIWRSYTRWFWVALALASVAVQATANAKMSAKHREIIDITECIITFAFDVEIVIRFTLEFPNWRCFFKYLDNWLDLVVAIGCTIIQIPVIHNSRAYPWLTLFQLARFFRVPLEVPRMRPLMLTVFGNLNGLVNMTLFLMLITFLAALLAIQLIQGDMPGTVTLNFGHLFNAFLGAYQILSKDSWTRLLYDTTVAELSRGQPIIVSTFLCCWLFFSNFIVMQMFIAVINENFDVAEEAKRQQSAETQSQTTSCQWLSKLDRYGWFRMILNAVHPWSTMVPEKAPTFASPVHHELAQRRASRSSSKSSRRRSSLRLLHGLFTGERDDPLRDLYGAFFGPRAPERPIEHETDEYFDLLTALKYIPMDSEDIRIMQNKRLIETRPTYDRTLWVFPQTNTLRRLCQRIVHPSGGERINGTPPSDNAPTFFQLAILLAVVGNIVTGAIATPLYKHHHYMQHGATRGAWFHVTDAAFGLILVVEFLIKIIADGFLFTPNAYIRCSWNILDFVIMTGVLVNVTFTLVFVGGLSRFIRALKALQALRLMTLIEKMRSTFEDLLLGNFIRVLDAAALAMLYLIPFSVWGTNIFAGLMNQCNDRDVNGIGDCTNEYVNTIHGNNFGFLVPHVWGNPSPSTTFSFDNFHSSLLILFEIVSQTGWVDVMSVAMSITGKDLQPQINASQANAIFFVVYNLLGAVVVLTLFVSIIIRNCPSRAGSAYLTKPQREWIDLQNVIKGVKPSKKPKEPPTSKFRRWCYDRAIHKVAWWGRMMTLLFMVQILVLTTEAFSAETANDWHNIILLVITPVYVVDVIIRLYGLGWRSFLTNGWNLFDVVVASGSFITTIFARFYPNSLDIQLLQKLFLVSMTFKLVQRVDALNHLFKSGMELYNRASLPVILNLLALWFTLFLFFAIMYMEVFGLTKWCSAEDSYRNYQTMGSALLMLVSLSTGGGWNQFMHDYALTYPRCTQLSDGVYRTDCGSTPWAYTLFIAWNLLSMYLFVNMFIGVVVRSFAYVFQSTDGVLKFIAQRGERTFKAAWAQFSNPDTELLERQNLSRFLAKLDGVLEVRIYPSKYSIASTLDACQEKSANATPLVSLCRLLNGELNEINFEDIRKRRAVYMRIYHEASLMCCRTGKKGIAFTEMLELLAHHKLIEDEEEALGLKELKRRKVILELVMDLVKLDKAVSHIDMKIVRKRYLRERNGLHGAGQGIPPNTGDVTEGPSSLKTAAPGHIASPSSNVYNGEGQRSEYNLTSITSSPRTFVASPELVASERIGSWDDLPDDLDALHSPTTQPPEEMRLLQADDIHT